MPISFVCGIFASLVITGERIILTSPVYCTREAFGIRSLADYREFMKTKIKVIPTSHITAFLSPITFFIIFILLSFLMLSGQARLYVFLIMLSGFLLSEKFFSRYIERMALALLFSACLLVALSLTAIKKTFVFLFNLFKPRAKSKKSIDNKGEVL